VRESVSTTEKRKVDPSKEAKKYELLTHIMPLTVVFMTDQIVSSLEAFGTAFGEEFEKRPISLTSNLMVGRVDILSKES